MAFAPLDGMDSMWESLMQAAIWSMVIGALMLGLIVWGVVAVVRAATGRPKGPAPGSRTCRSCGILVAPGNTNCPTCRAQMDWS
jgi:hypothetical protein